MHKRKKKHRRSNHDEHEPRWEVDSVEKFKPIYDKHIRPYIALHAPGSPTKLPSPPSGLGGHSISAGEHGDDRTPTAEEFWNEAEARACEAAGRPPRRGEDVEAGPNTEALLKHLLETSAQPLSRLCEALDTTLEGVSGWISERRNREHIGNLVHLLDAQTQLLMSQHRVAAVARLSQILRDARCSPETARRACSDMLKIQLVEPSELQSAIDLERATAEASGSPLRIVVEVPEAAVAKAIDDRLRELDERDAADRGVTLTIDGSGASRA